MLGPISEKYLFKGFQMGWILGYLPYTWDTRTKSLRVSQSKLRAFNMYGNMAQGIFYLAYCALSTLYLYFEKKNNPEYYIPFYMLGVMMTAALTIPPAFQFTIIKNRSELLRFPREFRQYMKEFQEKYVHPDEIARQRTKKHDQTGYIMMTFFYAGLCIVALIGLIILTNPDMPLLPSGVIPFPHWTFRWAFHITQTAVVTFHCLTLYGNQFFYAFQGLDYSFGLLCMLKEMNLNNPSYTTSDEIRTSKEFIKNFKILQLFHGKAMYMYSDVVLPVNKWSYLTICTYCVSSTIQMEGVLAAATFMGASSVLFWLVVAFTKFSEIHYLSRDVLMSWKSKRHCKLVVKILKTFKPLKVNMSSYYFCDRSMVLTMLKSIFEGAVDLIMVGRAAGFAK